MPGRLNHQGGAAQKEALYTGPLHLGVHYSSNELSLTNFKCVSIREVEEKSRKQLLYVSWYQMVKMEWQLGVGILDSA